MTDPCPKAAAVRVRLYEPDDTSAEYDFCLDHAGEVAGQYPDNIKLVEAFAQ